MKKKSLFYKFQFAMIFVMHFLLLYWIFYVLNHSGSYTTAQVMWHFLGLALGGGGLIVFCAKWAKYHFVKEVTEKHARK